ncbi:MAG TPA: hypothetical protein VKC17_12185 [Sphingomicrobium sp.]|nr:hypothetical protein [Sphingomicrobium sp.]
MNPFVRSSCCLAAVAALANCGGGSPKNENGSAANATQAAENATANTLMPAAPPALPAPAVSANEKRMTIEALPVAQPGPGVAVGSVHMVRSASGIVTDGFGGGCMVFEDPTSGVCHKDSDCHVPSYISAAGGPWAYCADQKCWIKPADKAFCWKSRYSTPQLPLQVGKPQSTPKVTLASLPAQLFQGPAKNQIRARVIACLNGKYKSGDAPPCAGGKGPRTDDIGDAKTLTK